MDTIDGKRLAIDHGSPRLLPQPLGQRLLTFQQHHKFTKLSENNDALSQDALALIYGRLREARGRDHQATDFGSAVHPQQVLSNGPLTERIRPVLDLNEVGSPIQLDHAVYLFGHLPAVVSQHKRLTDGQPLSSEILFRRASRAVPRRCASWNYTLRPEPFAPPVPPPPRDTSFGRFPPGDKTPAWLRHPSLTGLEPAAFDDLVIRYRAYLAEHPPILLPGKRPDGGPGAGGRRLSAADQLVVHLLKNRWSMAQAPLAEATGLSKNGIGATLRETTPVLAALGQTFPTGPLTVTTARQLAAIAGHNLRPE